MVEGSRLSRGWLPGNNPYEQPNKSAEQTKNAKLYWKTYADALHIVAKALLKHDVTIIAGTDANTNGTVPGYSLHDELVSLKNVGMSNTQVLRAATLDAAKWMQVNTGKIAVGYRADLILLDKSPLEEIKNTRTINTVITNGKLLDRTVLDEILLSIKGANNKSRKVNIDKFIK